MEKQRRMLKMTPGFWFVKVNKWLCYSWKQELLNKSQFMKKNLEFDIR